MCGLSGCAGSITHKEEKIVKTLLVFGQVRGEDSTGIGSVTRKSHYGGQVEMKLVRELGTPNYLFDTNRFQKVFNGTNSVFIGHNRSKTYGSVSRKNAHPFKFDTIMGAHNGTVEFSSKNRMEEGSSFDTDSEAIFNNIEVHGIEDTISRLEKNSKQVAYALTWYDKKDNTMNFLRNEERPLLYCTSDNGKTLWWCSEFGMLMAALYRDGVVPDDETAHAFTPNIHYKFRIPYTMTEAIGDPIRQKLEPAWERPLYHHNRHHQDNLFPKKTETEQTPSMTGKQLTTGGTEGSEKIKVSPDDPDMVWGGLFLGYVPKDKVQVIEKIKDIRAGLDELQKGLKGTTDVKVPGRVMDGLDVVRKRAWEHAEKGGIVPKDDAILARKMWDGQNLKVWRNSQTGLWTYLQYNVVKNAWEKWEGTKIPPDGMPLTMLDIQGGGKHCFKHVGRGKNKKVYYVGVNRAWLDREWFERIMKEGCVNCFRVPEWGNEVVFVSNQHEFLCEYCAMTPGLIKEYQDITSMKKSA